MKTHLARPRGSATPLLALIVLSPLSPLHAQTNGTWTTNGSGNWSDGGNWSGGNVASGAPAIADFSTLDIAGDHLVTLDSPYAIGTLLSQDATTPSHNWTLGGAGPLTLDNGTNKPVLNVINQSLAISAPLAGTTGFSKTGTGNLVLSGGGTLTGNVVVSAGTLKLGADNGISTSAGLEIFGGASASRTLDLAGFDQTLSGFVFNGTNLPGNLTITGGTSSKLTINTTTNTDLGPAGAMDADRLVTVDMSTLGGFEWSGSANTLRVGVRGVVASSNANTGVDPNATVTLATDNTITATTLAIGTQAASSNGGNSILRLGQTNVLNASTISIGTGGRNNATLEFNTGLTNPTATIRATDGTSRVTAWDVGRVFNVTQTTTWTATADFSAGQLDALVNSLRIGRADTGTSTSRIGTENGSFSMGKGTLDVTTLVIGQYAGTGSVNNTFNGNGTFNLNDATGTVTAENIILADNIGSATGGTTRTTSGTFNLTAGTLEAKTIDRGLNTGNATSTTRNFNFTSGTIRNYAGSDLAIANVPINLTGSGPRTFEATAGQSITLATTAPVSGSGGLTKTGGGTLSLQGASTYTGATDVQAGTLALSNSFPTGAITVDAAATLELANVTLIGQPALDIDGTLNLTGPVTVGGPLTAVPGTLTSVLQYGSITGAANLNHNYRSASFTVGATAADLNVAAGLALTWTGAGGSSWDLNTTVSWKDASNNPEKFFWADSVIFDSAGSGTPNVILAAQMQPASVTVNESLVDYVFSGPGFVSGTTGLTKNGAAKLTITTGNNNTGTTTINAGTLEIGNGGTTGSMGSGAIVNDASLVFNRSNDITIANAISGTGSLTKLGAGALSITSDNSYSGGTTISAGSLFVGRQTTGGSLGTGDIVNNGTLRLNRADGTNNPYAYTFANNISGTGALIIGQNVIGSSAFDAVVTVTGNNSFTGNVTVNSGGLKILNAAALGTGPKNIVLTNGSNGRPQLYLDGSGGNITLPAAFSLRTSNGDNNRPALGNLAGDNVIDGTLTLLSGGGNTLVKVIGGTLTLNGQIAAGTDGRILLLAGTLGANGTINGKMTNGTDPWGLNVVGPNTWTLTNNTNDYTGTTTVSGGTLALGADNVLPNATAVTLGAGTLNAATFDDAAGTLDCSGAATIHLGSGATLAFLASNGVDWTGGTLTITGTFVPGNGVDPGVGTNPGSLRFGTTNAGLSAGQLASISSPGWTGFALDDHGYLTATVAAGYASWASVNGAGINPSDDHDNDGVRNGVEYFLGGPNGTTTGFTALPGVTNTGGILSVTWTKAGDYAGTYGSGFVVETSDTLTGTWDSESSPGSTISIMGNDVTYTFPSPLGTRRFARLRVTGP